MHTVECSRWPPMEREETERHGKAQNGKQNSGTAWPESKGYARMQLYYCTAVYRPCAGVNCVAVPLVLYYTLYTTSKIAASLYGSLYTFPFGYLQKNNPERKGRSLGRT